MTKGFVIFNGDSGSVFVVSDEEQESFSFFFFSFLMFRKKKKRKKTRAEVMVDESSFPPTSRPVINTEKGLTKE